ncbi:probable G-protein coupled receptor No18 [Tigriopus californicus]|uniref:probable G-protein coupled receptor No18 n=1 Tax=Tigriopus californicus TaxID=6832 RepID=UPI0027D9D224|nr:probable G-protein coupled receptor No18 [Tigriopus californicus]
MTANVGSVIVPSLLIQSILIMNQTQQPPNLTTSGIPLENLTPLGTNLPFDLGGMEFSSLERLILLTYVITIIIFTIVSNAFVIYAVTHHNSLKIIPNYFLVSLSCTDILMATVVMPVALQYNLEGVWHYGVLPCKTWVFASYFSVASSIFHLCAIAIDRYRAITDPFGYGSKRTLRHLLTIVTFVWSLSFVVVSPPYFGWGISWPDRFDELTPCTIPQSSTYAIYSSVMCFYIPLIIIVGIYIKLFMIGRKRFRQKIRRAFELVEIHEFTRTNTDRHSPEDHTLGRFKEHPTAMSEGFVENTVPKEYNLDRRKSLSIPEEQRIVKHIVQGSKRRQLLPAMLFKMEPNINPSEEKIACSRCSGMIPKKQGRVCKLCSAPNNLVTAAENSRLAILLQREKRSVFIMTIIIFTFILCWMPAFSLYLVLAIFPQYVQLINTKLITMVWWMAYSNSACNPIIYTIFNKDFNDAFFKLIRKFHCFICNLNGPSEV